MTPCSTASELYEQGGSCTERERRRQGETSQAEKKKRRYLGFMSVGWFFFLKKTAAQRYWSNISVSLVSTAINLSVSTAEPHNSAVVLTVIRRLMDHIGNSKEQSLCYLSLYELSHLRQITHLWKELASHLKLKRQSLLQCRLLIFFFQSFLKVCLAWNLLLMCGYFFCCVLILLFFWEVSFSWRQVNVKFQGTNYWLWDSKILWKHIGMWWV